MIRVEHLAEVLHEITTTTGGDVDPVEFLKLLTTRTALMSNSLWAGVLLAGPEGQLQLAGASTESAATRELFAPEQTATPWLDCFRTGSGVVNIDLAQAEDRWPVLGPRAVSVGFRSVSVFPLQGGAEILGTLALLNSEPDHLEPRDVRILQALADVVTFGLRHRRRPHNRVVAPVYLQGSDPINPGTPGNPVNPAQLADPDLIETADPQTLLTPAEVAAMFRVAPKTITRWAKTGQLPAVRTLGGHRRYRHGEVTRLLKET